MSFENDVENPKKKRKRKGERYIAAIKPDETKRKLNRKKKKAEKEKVF
jgi:hypothetical protein